MIKILESIDVLDKKILVRADFNVPLENGKITSDKRIKSSLPTITYLIENGAKQIILMSHLGRPKGERNEKFSLMPIAHRLSELLGEPVDMVSDCIDVTIPDTHIVLLENLRFQKEEKEGDKKANQT